MDLGIEKKKRRPGTQKKAKKTREEKTAQQGTKKPYESYFETE